MRRRRSEGSLQRGWCHLGVVALEEYGYGLPFAKCLLSRSSPAVPLFCRHTKRIAQGQQSGCERMQQVLQWDCRGMLSGNLEGMSKVGILDVRECCKSCGGLLEILHGRVERASRVEAIRRGSDNLCHCAPSTTFGGGGGCGNASTYVLYCLN